MRCSRVLGVFALSFWLAGTLQAQTACQVPGAPAILFVPPGSVGVGQTYVIVWSDAPNLDDAGYYEVQRSTNSSFAPLLDSQVTFATSASFISTSETTSVHHRVRAIPSCDASKASPFSAARSVGVSAGKPSVIFTVQPKPIITTLNDSLSNYKATAIIENISARDINVVINRQELSSPPFFQVRDQATGELEFNVPPKTPKVMEIVFSGVPPNAVAAYQGVFYLQAQTENPNDQLTILPYAFVNLKVGGAESAAPEFLVDGKPSEYVFFPGFAGTSDSSRPPVQIEIRNPGTTPMEVGGEIGPEVWLEPEFGWNAQPIAPGSSRVVRLRTNRSRAPTGSALPRYTYFTIRTKSGESARLLVQDNDVASLSTGRGEALTTSTRSYIIPQFLSRTSGDTSLFSTLRLTNVGSETVRADLYFTPTDADGFDPSAVKLATILVPKNDVVTLTDPLKQVYALTPPVSGQLEVRSLPEKIGFLTVNSSAAAPAQGGGSFTYRVPTLIRGEGARLNAPQNIAGVASSPDLKTNLILAETTGSDSASVRVALFDLNGDKRGERLLVVPRYGQKAIDDVVTALSSGAMLDAARIDLTVTEGGGAVVGVATILDTRSSSASTLVSTPLGGGFGAKAFAQSAQQAKWAQNGVSSNSIVVPVAMSGPFATGDPRAYRTVLGLVAGAQSATFNLRFIDWTRGGASFTKLQVVPARKTMEFRDALKELFNLDSGQGMILASSTLGSTVYARLATAGSTVAPVGALPSFATIAQLLTSATAQVQRPLYLDGLEQSTDPRRGTRWILMLNEVGEQPATVLVRLYEAGNRSLPIAEKEVALSALQQVKLDSVFSQLGLDTNERRKDRTNVLAVVAPKSGAGLVSATAISIDNKTGDVETHVLTPNGGVPATGVNSLAPVRETPPPASGRRRGARRGQ